MPNETSLSPRAGFDADVSPGTSRLATVDRPDKDRLVGNQVVVLEDEVRRLALLRERQHVLFPRGPRLTVLPMVELTKKQTETRRPLRPDEEAALQGELYGARWERPQKKRRG